MVSFVLLARAVNAHRILQLLKKRLERLKLNSELQSSFRRTNRVPFSHYGPIMESRIARIRDSTLPGSLLVKIDIK